MENATPEPVSGGRRTLRTAADLVRVGLVASDALSALEGVARRYAVAISPEIAALMVRGAPDDPIARQFLPDLTELQGATDEWADPIGDAAYTPLPGLIHRYPDRVLLTPTLTCAVYCRFCFRRERVGPTGGGGALGDADLDAALAYIRARPEIWEVILTGGDPLTLASGRLGALVAALDAMAHVGAIRIHTRVPVVAPERVNGALLAALRCHTALFVAIHANHPREFTPAASAAILRLVGAGIPMVSQSVLLRGVNDDPLTLEALMRRFVEHRIKPYYLHHLDAAPGTARFRVPIQRGQALMRALRGRVSGLCQPDYVLDVPGGHGKSPIGPQYLAADGTEIDDWRGQRHRLPDTPPDRPDGVR